MSASRTLFPLGPERLNQRQDICCEPIGGSPHIRGTAAADTPPALIEHQDAIVPEPVATPTLPEWPGPHPPPPLVAHLYAPYARPQLGLPPQPGLRMSAPSRGRAVRR
jgi:hypothetical protein